jgi:outer membrane protein OmpA-like peptidoglycan-associated protein
VNKQIIMALCCALVTGCSFSMSSTPHSDYFIIAFDAATADPSAEGKVALENALRKARSASRVMIEGAVNDSPSNADNGSLVQQRAAELEQDFAKSGVAPAAIKFRLRQVGDAEFASRKDSLIIQLGFGTETAE